MRSKHIFVETCQLIIIFHLTHAKTVSQNVANFRSLGYMPDQVALELRQMQTGYSAPRYQKANYGAYANAFNKPEGDKEPIKEAKLRTEPRKNIRHTREREEDTEVETDPDAKKRFAVKDVVIDFDELVNKVKDKLKDEFNEKKKIDGTENAYGPKNDLRNNPDMETGKKDISLSLRNTYKSNVNQESDANEPREAWKHFMTSKPPKAVVGTPKSQPSRVRVPMKKMKKEKHPNDEIFELADLTKKKDSYEDYVTPKRAPNVYASDTDTETEAKNPVQKNEGKSKESYKENEELYNPKESYRENEELLNPKDSYKENEELYNPKESYRENEELLNPKENYKENEELNDPKENYNGNEDMQLQYKNIPKAADILKAGRSSDKLRKIKKLDDPIDLVVDDYDPNETEKPADHSEKAMFVKLGGDSDDDKRPKLKGTMIPTRQFYKMSSPNYYGKLPAVAEKYDFNEPLPDKDREPEKLKYFNNPPARINRKVKLQPHSDSEQENK